MKTGWKLLMVTGVVLVVLAGQVVAQPGGGPGRGPGRGRGPGLGLGRQPAGPMGPGGVLGPIAGQLNLTAAQRDAIRDICRQSRADANEVVEAVDNARAALHEAVIGGASAEQIRAAAATLGTAIGNQAVLQAQTVAAAKAVLTTEQLKQFEETKGRVPHARRPVAGPGFGGGPWGGPWGLQARRPGPGGGPWGGPRGLPAHRPGPGGGPAPMPHLGLEQMFKAADTNHDGVLSLEELRAFHGTVRGPGGPWRQ
jgi:Spy/CpxP family protein refolding chaperone